MIARAADLPVEEPALKLVAIIAPLAQRRAVELLLMGLRLEDGRAVYRGGLAMRGFTCSVIERAGVEAWRIVVAPTVSPETLQRRLPGGCVVERYYERDGR